MNTKARLLLLLGLTAVATACNDESTPLAPAALATQPSLAKGGPKALPTNGRIYFTSDMTGNFDVYSMNADGSDRRRLTITSADEAFMNVSRDGKKLVLGTLPATGGAELVTMNVDGSNRRVIVSEAGGVIIRHAAFSPDGRTIAYATDAGNGGNFQSIWTVPVNGGKRTRLTQPTESAMYPSWSPDGTRILYTRGPIGSLGEDLYIMNADGSNQTMYYDCTDACYNPQWSADGTQIIYIKSKSGLFIERCNEYNECGIPVPHTGYPTHLALSPDGSQFVTATVEGVFTDHRINVSNFNGSGQLAVTAPLYSIGTVAWGR